MSEPIDFDQAGDEIGKLEREVLGCMMEFPRNNPRIRQRLQASHFSRETHSRLYLAICDADNAGEANELTRVTLRLRAMEGFCNDDLAAVASLDVSARIEVMIDRNVQTVLDAHRLRTFAMKAAELGKHARNGGLLLTGETVQQFFNETAAELTPFFAAGASTKTNYSATEMSRELEALINSRRNSQGKVIGIPTGYENVDNVLGGLQRKALYVIAAATGAGKTAFALNIARNASRMAQAKTLMVSLEMDRIELWSRLLSQESRVGGMKIQTGIISEAEDAKLTVGYNELRKLQVRSLEPPPTNIVSLRAEAQAQARNEGLDILVVDYLQLMSGTRNDRGGSREREVAEISRGLKLLAMELGVVVIAISQLNRSGDRNARPSLSMLRESGAIEQDANAVVFLWSESDDAQDVCWCVAKNRSGPLGEGRLRFERSTQRFIEGFQNGP